MAIVVAIAACGTTPAPSPSPDATELTVSIPIPTTDEAVVDAAVEVLSNAMPPEAIAAVLASGPLPAGWIAP